MTEGAPDERPSQDKYGTARRNIRPKEENQATGKSRNSIQEGGESVAGERGALYHTKLIATMPDIMVRMNLNGEILFVNEVGLQLSGYQRTELIGQNMFSFIAPDDHDKAARNAASMLERKW
jgi:PAS domain-containing protein